MRLLLDTQIALWWLTASPRLSKASRELVASSPCTVSVASIGSCPQHGLGKLPVSPLRFRDEMLAAGAIIVSVSDEHVLTAAGVAGTHRDPFDRLLLGVALAEGLQFLTADTALTALAESQPRLPIREA